MAKNSGPKSSMPGAEGNTQGRQRPARRSLQPAKRHDWTAIKRAYIEGVVENGRLTYPGPSKLSELFGAPRSKISARASEEGWETERALRQRGIQEAATVQKASLLAAELAMEEEAQRREGRAPRRVSDKPRAASDHARVAESPDDLPPNQTATGDGTPAGPSGMPATHHDVPVVRRTLDGSAIQLATAVAAFDAKAARIAEGAMTVGAKLLLGKELKSDGEGPSRRVALTPKEYKETVEGIRAAHAMGRLALGQTTENQGISNPNGGPVKVDQNVSVNDGRTGDSELDNLTPAELARRYVEAARACGGGGEE